METKTKVILGSVAVVVAFAFGRYSAPEKVKIETKTVEVEKKVTDKQRNVQKKKHLVTTITETEKPDGTKTKVTKITEEDDSNSNTNVSQTDTTNKSTDTTKEITYSSKKYSLSALAGTQFSFSSPITPIYGGMFTRQILGPINAGVFGLSNKVGGISLGLTF